MECVKQWLLMQYKFVTIICNDIFITDIDITTNYNNQSIFYFTAAFTMRIKCWNKIN